MLTVSGAHSDFPSKTSHTHFKTKQNRAKTYTNLTKSKNNKHNLIRNLKSTALPSENKQTNKTLQQLRKSDLDFSLCVCVTVFLWFFHFSGSAVGSPQRCVKSMCFSRNLRLLPNYFLRCQQHPWGLSHDVLGVFLVLEPTPANENQHTVRNPGHMLTASGTYWDFPRKTSHEH